MNPYREAQRRCIERPELKTLLLTTLGCPDNRVQQPMPGSGGIENWRDWFVPVDSLGQTRIELSDIVS